MLSRERMQERFLELVQIYSPSGGEKEQCRWLMNYFKERGIEASIDEAGKAYGGNGGNIIAHVKGEPCNPPFCFVAHLDQIEPCKDVRPVVDGHIIRTDGTTTLGEMTRGLWPPYWKSWKILRRPTGPTRSFISCLLSLRRQACRGPNIWTRPACHVRTWS